MLKVWWIPFNQEKTIEVTNVDNTEKPPRILSICTGYGGIERGLERVFGGISVLAHVEIEAFAVTNLVAQMEAGELDPVPIWTDLKTFNATCVRGVVDILTGGYPCQPFSNAGKRLGEDDPRHLWPHVQRVIDECKPRRVFLENVEGHLSKGVVQVLADLEEMGYRPKAGIFSAEEVGAPHRRKRVFILADSQDTHRRHRGQNVEGFQGERRHLSGNFGETMGHAQGDDERRSPFASVHREGVSPGGPGGVVADAESDRRGQGWAESEGIKRGLDAPECGAPLADADVRREQQRRDAGVGWIWEPVTRFPAGRGAPQQAWEPSRVQRKSKPGLGRNAYGRPHRIDRLRLLGNGVVPETAAKAFVTLEAELCTTESDTEQSTHSPVRPS